MLFINEKLCNYNRQTLMYIGQEILIGVTRKELVHSFGIREEPINFRKETSKIKTNLLMLENYRYPAIKLILLMSFTQDAIDF